MLQSVYVILLQLDLGGGGFHMNIHFNINQFNYRDRCLEHPHISGAKKNQVRIDIFS